MTAFFISILAKLSSILQTKKDANSAHCYSLTVVNQIILDDVKFAGQVALNLKSVRKRSYRV